MSAYGAGGLGAIAPERSGVLGSEFRAQSSGFAPVAQDDVCEGLQVDLTRGRYLLFRRATRRYEKPCYASFLPSMPTERSRFLTTAAQIRHTREVECEA